MLIQKPKKTFVFKFVIIVLVIAIYSGLAFGTYYFLDKNESAQLISHQKQLASDKNTALKAIAAAKEAKKKEPVYITLPGSASIRAIVDDYSIQSSLWSIASKTHPISVDYVPAGLKIPSVATRTDKSDEERSVRSDIETPLANMFAAAASEGYQLVIGSGYRSANLQSTYFYSLANSVGETIANQSIARPGESEHQTGLAIDITTVSRNCYLADCFANTYDGKWLANNSYKYGFILRYPKGKEDITGYIYEPWHFRYVGVDLATALHESGLTLDEAWPYLESADKTLRANGAF